MVNGKYTPNIPLFKNTGNLSGYTPNLAPAKLGRERKQKSSSTQQQHAAAASAPRRSRSRSRSSQESQSSSVVMFRGLAAAARRRQHAATEGDLLPQAEVDALQRATMATQAAAERDSIELLELLSGEG